VLEKRAERSSTIALVSPLIAIALATALPGFARAQDSFLERFIRAGAPPPAAGDRQARGEGRPRCLGQRFARAEPGLSVKSSLDLSSEAGILPASFHL